MTISMSTKLSHRMTLSVCKPASFWQEKRDTDVILVWRFAKNVVVSKEVKNMAAVLAYFDRKNGSFTSYNNY